MATYSTGITASWNGTPFTEVQQLSWSYGGARQGRDSNWSAEQGSVSLTCLGTANTATSNRGDRYQLVITGGGADISSYAVWETVSVAPELNGVTRYTVTFRLLDN